jgi:heme/copper-type cytochrome/quinol oxidase subunit 3
MTVEVAARPLPRPAAVPSGVLAMLVLVSAEIMLFAGMISAFVIGRAGAGALGWPPADQPRLPVAATAVNTGLLLLSGAVLAGAQVALREGRRARAGALLATALGLGALFVAWQGYEWVALIHFGLTLTSSTFGAFFYLIVGAHAAHAVAALVALGWAASGVRSGRLAPARLQAVSVFWYFVVGLWPILYLVVYLL